MIGKAEYYPFFNLDGVIEYVDEVKINPCNMAKVTYTIEKDVLDTLKWCRRNFGNRGDGWDFTGNNRKLTITIWSTKLLTMYEICKN